MVNKDNNPVVLSQPSKINVVDWWCKYILQKSSVYHNSHALETSVLLTDRRKRDLNSGAYTT